MNSRETIFVRRKAEEQLIETEKAEGYPASGRQGQIHRKKKLNEKLWVTVPPYGGNIGGDHYDLRTARKKVTNYLDRDIRKMDNGK